MTGGRARRNEKALVGVTRAFVTASVVELSGIEPLTS